MTCPHLRKRIDGIWKLNDFSPPIAVAWTCEICRTSGSTLWAKSTRADRRQAQLADLAKMAGCEMAVR